MSLRWECAASGGTVSLEVSPPSGADEILRAGARVFQSHLNRVTEEDRRIDRRRISTGGVYKWRSVNGGGYFRRRTNTGGVQRRRIQQEERYRRSAEGP